MRVTNSMMSNRLLTNINRNLGLLDKYNTQASTGQKIRVPSDDPIIASRALKFRTMLSENEQYIKNTDDANSWIDTTEAVYENMNNILGKMKELAVNGANDTNTLEDRKKILTEYMSLVEQLEQELNTDYMGRNIFSGFRTDTKPIIKGENGKNILNPQIYGDANANPPITSIDGQIIEVQVGAGVNTGINTLATKIYDQNDYYSLRGGAVIVDSNNNIFKATVNPDGSFSPLPPPAPQPQGDRKKNSTYFQAVIDFMESPDYNNMPQDKKLQWEKDNDLRGVMAQMVDGVDEYQAKMAVEQTETGVRSSRVELVQTRLKDDQVNIEDVKSKNEGADLAEVMMNFNLANSAYTASLHVGMNITQISLADYLR